MSKYLKEGELEPLQERIEKRKELQATLSELEKLFAKTELSRHMKQEEKFNTNILVGGALISMVRGVEKWKRRFCYSQLEKYLRSDETDRVCILYGLRRTGKTTMMRQAIADMTSEQLSKTAYIKIKKADDLDILGKDLMKLFENGFRYVFIDEVTLLEDFIDCASLLSDIYACMGMKIVLSGTDSLGFWMATHQELYDRARMIHTTYIPYMKSNIAIKLCHSNIVF